MEEIVPVDNEVLPGVLLGDLVKIKGAPSFLATQIREYPLPLSRGKIHIIPSRYIRDIASRFTRQSVIISGTKTVVIPHSLYGKIGKTYAGDLIHFLLSRLLKKSNRVEIDIISTPEFQDFLPDHRTVFQFHHTRDYLGYIIGRVRVEEVREKRRTGKFLQSGSIHPGDNRLTEDFQAEGLEGFEVSPEYGWPVDIQGDSRGKREWVLHVHQHIPVLKAKEGLEKNQDLTWDDLFMAEGLLSPYKGELFLPGEEVGGYKTIKKVRQGEILYSSFIRKSMKVRAGERVFITLQKGNIRLSMTGRAGDSGGIGDMIKVRPSQSTGWITGTVSGRGEVYIEL
jgi:flagella basal body P-ring formation protein FlgA